MKKIIITLFILYNFANILYAYTPGTIGGQILKFSLNSRATAMGDSFCSVSDDASAVYWNPAGLSKINNIELLFTHMNRLAGIRTFNFASAIPLKSSYVLGLGGALLYAESPRRDRETGNRTGHFMNYNSYTIIALSKQITSNFSIGFGKKIIYNKLDSYTSGNTGIDIGSIYTWGKYNFGLNIQNIATGIKLGDNIETLPLNIKMGTSYRTKAGTLSLDLNIPQDTKPIVNFGSEYLLNENFILRAGYKYKTAKHLLGNISAVSMGFGVKFSNYTFNYAYAPQGNLGNKMHWITIKFSL